MVEQLVSRAEGLEFGNNFNEDIFADIFNKLWAVDKILDKFGGHLFSVILESKEKYYHETVFGLEENQEESKDSADRFLVQVVIKGLSEGVDFLGCLGLGKRYFFLLAFVEVLDDFDKVAHQNFVVFCRGVEEADQLSEVVFVPVEKGFVDSFVVDGKYLGTNVGQLADPIFGVSFEGQLDGVFDQPGQEQVVVVFDAIWDKALLLDEVRVEVLELSDDVLVEE